MPHLDIKEDGTVEIPTHDRELPEPGTGLTAFAFGTDGSLRTRIKGGEETPVGGSGASGVPTMPILYQASSLGGNDGPTWVTIDVTTHVEGSPSAIAIAIEASESGGNGNMTIKAQMANAANTWDHYFMNTTIDPGGKHHATIIMPLVDNEFKLYLSGHEWASMDLVVYLTAVFP